MKSVGIVFRQSVGPPLHTHNMQGMQDCHQARLCMPIYGLIGFHFCHIYYHNKSKK